MRSRKQSIISLFFICMVYVPVAGFATASKIDGSPYFVRTWCDEDIVYISAGPKNPYTQACTKCMDFDRVPDGVSDPICSFLQGDRIQIALKAIRNPIHPEKDILYVTFSGPLTIPDQRISVQSGGSVDVRALSGNMIAVKTCVDRMANARQENCVTKKYIIDPQNHP